MRRFLLSLASITSASLVLAQDAKVDPIDDEKRLIEADEVVGVILKFDSPVDEIRYLIDDYKAAQLNPFNQNPELIMRRARSAPGTYFPLLREGWEDASDRAEAEAYLARFLDTYHETHGEELRVLLLPLLRGDASRSFEPCEDCMEEELFLPYLAMEQMRLFPLLARPEDARLMLPFVMQSDEHAISSTALEAISRIADPDILPELETVVRRRMELYPESYSDVELYLSVGLKTYTRPILERYAQKHSESNPEEGAAAALNDAFAAQTNSERAPTALAADGVTSGGEIAETDRNPSVWLWLVGVVALLGIGWLAVRRRGG